jgi:hypothetical protein
MFSTRRWGRTADRQTEAVEIRKFVGRILGQSAHVRVGLPDAETGGHAVADAQEEHLPVGPGFGERLARNRRPRRPFTDRPGEPPVAEHAGPAEKHKARYQEDD